MSRRERSESMDESTSGSDVESPLKKVRQMDQPYRDKSGQTKPLPQVPSKKKPLPNPPSKPSQRLSDDER